MECDRRLGEVGDYRIAREAAGGHEGEGGGPGEAQPAGGDAKGVADDREKSEGGGGGAVAAHPGEGAPVERARREEAADRVGGHAAGGVGGGGDGDREGGVLGVQVEIGEERRLGGQ